MNPLSICTAITKVVAGVWIVGSGLALYMQKMQVNALKEALEKVQDTVTWLQ